MTTKMSELDGTLMEHSKEDLLWQNNGTREEKSEYFQRPIQMPTFCSPQIGKIILYTHHPIKITRKTNMFEKMVCKKHPKR